MGYPSYAGFVDFKEWATLAFFVDFKEWATPPYAFLVDFKEWATPLMQFFVDKEWATLMQFLLILRSGLPLHTHFC